MQRPDQAHDCATQQNGVKPLPLFRPEVLAAQQHKFYGQIVLIRPFSLMFLGWIGAAIAACAMAFLVLGRYTEKVRVPGILAVRSGTTSSDGPPRTGDFYVPIRWRALIHPGDRVLLRCQACPDELRESSGTVQQISSAPLNSVEGATRANISITEPSYKVTVSLTPPAAQTSPTQISQTQVAQVNAPSQTAVQMEAEIPLGRKPFIQWLFERSGT